MVLAWIIAEWTTHITNEAIIERGYDNIIEKLNNIGVDIKQVSNE